MLLYLYYLSIGFLAVIGVKTGWSMLAIRTENQAIFDLWAFTKADLHVYGTILIAASLLILIPYTFFIGTLVAAFYYFMLIAVRLSISRFKGALAAFAFFVLDLATIYLNSRQ
jgi:hypothetical protein